MVTLDYAWLRLKYRHPINWRNREQAMLSRLGDAAHHRRQGAISIHASLQPSVALITLDYV